MTLEAFITLFAGVLAAIGLAGILGGAMARHARARHRIFRTGSVAMGSAGVVLLLGGLLGHADIGQMFGGFMLLVFGTAVSLPTAEQGTAPAESVSRT